MVQWYAFAALAVGLWLVLHAPAARDERRRTDPRRRRTATARKGRRTLLLIALVDVAPVVASYAAYYWFPARQQRTTASCCRRGPAPAVAGHDARRRAVRASPTCAASGCCCRRRRRAATRRARRRSTRRGRRARCRGASRSASSRVLARHRRRDARRRAARRASGPRRRARAGAGRAGRAAARAPTASILVDPLGNLVLRLAARSRHQGRGQGPRRGCSRRRGSGEAGPRPRVKCAVSPLPRPHDPPSRPMTALALAETRFRQFLALTKPRVVSLIVFCAVIGMFLAVAGPAAARARCSAATLGIALVAGAAAAINCLVEQKIDALMARTRARPLPRGELTSAADAGVRRRRRRHRAVAALSLRQPADDVADARHVRRLRDRLHGAAQARDAAEHRDRRRVGRDAAGAGLGRGDQRRRARGAAAVPDHLRLDAAALLGAGALPHAGLREGRPADAAGHARLEVHAAA